MKIFLGPAGVPIVSKDRSSLGGLKTVKELRLNAMEIEFVRGVKMEPKLAEEVGKVAKELGISLSVHSPYYINLNSQKKQIIEASKRMIFDSADRAERMGAGAVAIHTAYYSGFNPEQTFEKTKEGLSEVLDKMKSTGIKNVKLGVETMGRWSQFGSLDECVKMAKEIDIIPYIDWSHLFVRGKGTIDYGNIFDTIKQLKLKHVYSHFQNVQKNKKGEYVDVHVPLDHSPPFEPLAKEILKRKVDITVISESPIIEQDSLKMKKILEKAGFTF
ncbi:MAG: TIM barrel protein [Candidatus Aenigmatarchaeota archaeon]